MKRKLVFSAFVLLVASAVFGYMYQYGNGENGIDSIGGSASALVLPNPAFAQVPGNVSLADIAEKCVDSVVNISSTKVVRTPDSWHGSPFFDDPFFRRFFGPNFQWEVPKEQRQKSLGSGVIVSEDGIILTNNHVIQDADELKVFLRDKREFDAEVVGADPQSDLAVIRLKGDDIKGLKPMKFGDSDKLRLGDVVLAIGNPFGLSNTVTMGIVSAKGRSFDPRYRITEYEDFIQTDAAINPGNSGGALINLRGELVGINTAIFSRSGGYQGIGFAIPSNMAKVIMDDLVADGKIVRGWLGVQIQDVTPEIADALGLPSAKGAMVSDVMDDSPASKAGIKTGDVIIRVGDDEIESSNDLKNKIAMLGADKTVTVTVNRNGKEKKIRVKLGERPEDFVLASGGTERGGGIGGLSVVSLTPATREKYGIPDEVENGVIVTGVEPGSRAEEAYLRPNDVILEINKKPVESVSMFRKEYKKAKKSVLLYIYRDGNRFFTVMKK